MSHALALSGLAVILVGFLLRLQPLLVVAVAAAVTGLTGGMGPVEILAAFGKAFNTNRFVTVVYVVLPLIGLIERNGLQERARAVVAGMRGLSLGRLLAAYMLLRQISAGLGLVQVAGHPQTVRPLLAPMAETAADPDDTMPPPEREQVRALAAATDNIALFFGEDVFIAIGSILLMKGFLDQYGIVLEPLALSVWAIPTAICAFLIHGARLMWMDRRRAARSPSPFVLSEVEGRAPGESLEARASTGSARTGEGNRG
ncbi:DUF969 domain-containing protein [Sphingomonas sp. AP4-R1]|uniref:DUF969 domain-containing protein n=1 Tax=Sphingomonas sp. AP4-R1 TaxID=2735134 RepID=UPI0014937BFD|nr:DUF969 domain-containing protein [Sphingomonas sp. AP4-R1]QJU58493.1 DUF969 domain-containing protein [Sphingomonas sp. AP4-R1]